MGVQLHIHQVRAESRRQKAEHVWANVLDEQGFEGHGRDDDITTSALQAPRAIEAYFDGCKGDVRPRGSCIAHSIADLQVGPWSIFIDLVKLANELVDH